MSHDADGDMRQRYFTAIGGSYGHVIRTIRNNIINLSIKNAKSKFTEKTMTSSTDKDIRVPLENS